MFVFDAMNCSRLDRDYTRRVRTGGVDAFHTSVVWGDTCDLRVALERLEQYHSDLARLSDEVILALSVAELRAAKIANRIAIVLGLQNITPLENGDTLLAMFRRLGVRIVQLTYNARNLVGDGCMERCGSGLSNFGVALIRQLNDLRIAIDVSHAGERTLLEAVSTSRMPVICSHANARALCDSPRNLSDIAISAIAQSGGVIGVTSIGHFVKAGSPALEDILDHIDHIVRLVGADHVGIGSDLFEGRHLDVYYAASALARGYKVDPTFFNPRYPEGSATDIPEKALFPVDPSWSRRAQGFQKVVEMPNVLDGLRRRGYTSRQIEQIMGENFLRVLGEVWGA